MKRILFAVPKAAVTSATMCPSKNNFSGLFTDLVVDSSVGFNIPTKYRSCMLPNETLYRYCVCEVRIVSRSFIAGIKCS